MTTPVKHIKAPIQWYVALIEDGVPKFSTSPVAHLTPAGARAEADRLAAAHPGQAFGIFGQHDLLSKAKKPLKLSYEDLKTAKPGVYNPFNRRLEAYPAFMRVLVLGHPGQQNTLLFLEGTDELRIEPLDASSWKHDLFELDESTKPRSLSLQVTSSSMCGSSV